MSNVPVATQEIVRTGLAPSYTGSLSTSNTYQVSNDGHVFLHVKKTGAGACNVTVQTPGQVDGLDIADLVVSVPATTGDKLIGPFPVSVYGSTLNVTFSEITGLTVAALRFG